MSTIQPSVGRKVWFWGASALAGSTMFGNNQPFDATVTFVWTPTCVNLLVVDHAGLAQSLSSVLLRDPQDGDSHSLPPTATWMPYQVGQAKK